MYGAAMNTDHKTRLAMTGETDNSAASLRLRAARKMIGFTQEQLAEAGGVKKSAVTAMERGRSFPNRGILVFLYREYRIDFNFMIAGAYAQLPGDVQAQLFDALSDAHDELDQTANSGPSQA